MARMVKDAELDDVKQVIDEAGPGVDESELEGLGDDFDTDTTLPERGDGGRFTKTKKPAKAKPAKGEESEEEESEEEESEEEGEDEEESEEEGEDEEESEDEDEDEEEEESEDEDEEEEEAEDDGAKKVPRGQLRRILRQRDSERARVAALEVENERLRKTTTPAAREEKREDPTVALKATRRELYKKVEKARADNNMDEAAEIQERIDDLTGDIARYNAEETAGRSSAHVAQVTAYNSMIERVSGVFDELRQGSKDYDQEAVDAIQDMTDGMVVKRSHSPADALRIACKRYFGVDPSDKKAVQTYLDDLEKTAKPKPVLKKKTDVKKNIEKKKKVPARAVRSTHDPDGGKFDAESMDVEDWEKLPASAREKYLDGMDKSARKARRATR